MIVLSNVSRTRILIVAIASIDESMPNNHDYYHYFFMIIVNHKMHEWHLHFRMLEWDRYCHCIAPLIIIITIAAVSYTRIMQQQSMWNITVHREMRILDHCGFAFFFLSSMQIYDARKIKVNGAVQSAVCPPGSHRHATFRCIFSTDEIATMQTAIQRFPKYRSHSLSLSLARSFIALLSIFDIKIFGGT